MRLLAVIVRTNGRLNFDSLGVIESLLLFFIVNHFGRNSNIRLFLFFSYVPTNRRNTEENIAFFLPRSKEESSANEFNYGLVNVGRIARVTEEFGCDFVNLTD